MTVIPAPTEVARDALARRYLDAALPGGEAPEVASMRFRGCTRRGRVWVPFTATETVEPRRWYLRRSRVAGVLRVDEGSSGGSAFRRTSLGRLVAEDDSTDAEHRALAHRALAAPRVPGCLHPSSGTVFSRVDRDHLRVRAGDLDLTLRVGPRGDLAGVATLGWGDPTGSGMPDWFPVGQEVRELRTVDGVRIPWSVTVGWFPETPRWAPFLRYRVVDWSPVTPLDPCSWV